MTPTPPSTSSSVGTHSPEGQFRVIRKRNRVPLSCAPCRQRKLKCNRAHPCENCVKRGDASSCNYAQASARKKTSPLQGALSSPDDMQNRIDRLESLVLSLMTNGTQSAGPAAAMAAISANSSGGSGATPRDFDEKVSHGQEESDTEQVTKSFGVLKMDNKMAYYISEAHWASVLNDISEVRNFFNTHKRQIEEHSERLKASRPKTDATGSSLLFGATKPMSREEIMASFPSRYITDMLITRYFNSRDPSSRESVPMTLGGGTVLQDVQHADQFGTDILHGPTFQVQYNHYWENPAQASITFVGMLFAMMRLAMLSYHQEGDEPPEFRDKSLDMAGNFRNLLAQCLAVADYTRPHPFLVESLLLHLSGDCCQSRDGYISAWVLVGVIARLAMRSGYHRDSKFFPNITPFQGEMRRRLWTYVRQLDLLFSFQVGLPSMLHTADSDTELPRNLYDEDFDEDCKELPPSRPPNEPTPISYLIAKARLSFAFGRVIEHTSSVKSGSYDTVMEIDAELRQARDLIPEHLRIIPLEECPSDPPSLISARFAVNSVYHKAQCVLHRRYLVPARENPRFTYSRQTCIDSAMELLRYQSMIHKETCPTGRLRSRQNQLLSLGSTDFILAAMIVSLDLYHTFQLHAAGRPSGDTYTWGLERRDEMLAAVTCSKEIWSELREESMEAWKAANILEVMLAKINVGSPGPNAAGFEAHDEKQSAAMTLGLLSSGVSPMTSGPSVFPDGNYPKIGGDHPTVSQNGVGGGGGGGGGIPSSTVDLPAAPSPFNNMFGQMPDMQVNLDWDAWDNYIQYSNLEAQQQWWPMFDPQQQQQQVPGGPNSMSSARGIPPAVTADAASSRSHRLPGILAPFNNPSEMAFDHAGLSGHYNPVAAAQSSHYNGERGQPL